MRILVDIGHPGHVHLFRNAVKTWRHRGHHITIAIRDRDLVAELLRAYDLDFHVASKARFGLLGLAWELVEHDWNVLRLSAHCRPDLLIGTSVAVSHVSRIMGAKSIVFNEDDADIVPLFAKLSYPLADTIVVPNCVRDHRTAKYVTHNSYHELAYLHPNNFEPDPSILSELGVKDGEPFFIVRLVDLKAHHDTGQTGISRTVQRKIIAMLSEKAKVFITAEGTLPKEFQHLQFCIPPYRIHHALHHASLLVSDSQTMTAEAAVLGTPAIRCNTFVGRISYLEELEHKYELTYGFLPKDEDLLLETIANLIDQDNVKGEWQKRRNRMLADKEDFSLWMVNFVEGFLHDRKKYTT